VKLRHVAPLACLAFALISGCTKQQARAFSDITGKVACAVARAELPDEAIVEQCDTLWSDVADAVISTRRKVAAARHEERERVAAMRCGDGGAP
jgi:hypothetical protein